MLLEGKIALIIGAATGFGRASARHFAREGARVIVADINDAEGTKTVEGIKSEGREARYLHCDASRVKEIEQTIKDAAAAYGRIDIFWHNAGIFFPGHIEAIEEEHYDKEMAVGFKAAIFGTKYLIPVMRGQGGGSILYTSSMVGLRPNPYSPRYSLTHGIEKAALIMLMRCVVEPLAAYNIRVNCICPGPVSTPLWERAMIESAQLVGIAPEAARKAAGDRLPIKRLITEEEIAEAAAFLVSDKARGVTGVAFPVDGGFSAV
jgi:NAD(P)-dependent dehydrogenase (short-subunit alcohol dehydrogenase family)